MKRIQLLFLMLCCLMLSHLTAWADDDPNTIVFQETFDQTKGTGGRDGVFTGSVGSSAIKYDNDGWTEVEKCGGASQCLKFGTGSASGTLTSPEISVGNASYVLLTFSAAGWGDASKNYLKVETNEGFTIESGDNDIEELENAVWNDYTVLIKVTKPDATLQLTFTGKRGFLDDIVVRALVIVPAPTLPDNFTFFHETSEEISAHHVMLTPVSYTAAYYTTDGSEPSNSNGTEALLPTNIPIHGTTTVKAVAYVGDMPSEVVSRTYTEGIILVPSPKVATYDLKPEMSAYEVCDNLVKAIKSDKYDVIIINFANPDMVGHTGVLPAAIKAIEAVDE